MIKVPVETEKVLESIAYLMITEADWITELSSYPKGNADDSPRPLRGQTIFVCHCRLRSRKRKGLLRDTKSMPNPS